MVSSPSLCREDTMEQASRDLDAAKKVNGRKGHLFIGKIGLPLVPSVTAACVRDRERGTGVLGLARRLTPSPRRLFADGG